MDDESVNRLLKLLQDGIQQILTSDQAGRESGFRFMELYDAAYTLTQQRRAMMMYTDFMEILTQHVITKVLPHLLSLLHHNFLQELHQTWIKYQSQITMIADIFVHTDYVYSRNHGMENVFESGAIVFRDHVVDDDSIKQRVQTELLGLIEQSRKGEGVDRALIKNICKMLIILDLNDTDVYEECFEEPFLNTSTKFFQTESQKFLTEEGADTYLKKVEERMAEEVERVQSCLAVSTAERLIQVLLQEMIINHMKTIVDMEASGLVFMLEHKQTEDVARMYRLLGRVPGGLQLMCDTMSSYVRQHGKAVLSGPGARLNPVEEIQSLLDLKNHCDHFLTESFDNNKLCRETTVRDFEHIFNLSSSSPEKLSLYIDNMLKRGLRGPSLDEALMLFKFLPDKDVFERFYRQHLSSRMLTVNSPPYIIEKNLILMLKREYGVQLTSKLEKMFKDISISKVTNKMFWCEGYASEMGLCGIYMTVKVLTAGIWPIVSPVPNCILPCAASVAFESFRSYYLMRNKGRHLSLQTHLGWANVQVTFCRSLKKERGPEAGAERPRVPETCILRVSTLQMTVLMLFNHSDRLTFKEIQQETNIPKRELVPVLQPLLWRSSERVLLKEPSSNEMKDNDIFTVNDDLSCKHTRIKIKTVPVRKKGAVLEKDMRHKVEKERKQKLEAAIVRIMKAKRMLPHEVLVSEASLQLKDSFRPSANAVKRCIEGLIEKEYLERTAGDRMGYLYVP